MPSNEKKENNTIQYEVDKIKQLQSELETIYFKVPRCASFFIKAVFCRV